eukprot:GDKJ01017989.1.p1 GENE.GDKJ01017989.1~~GDKJ01017989.1.p1  ORF type:complete len:131 (+),score=15.28 GDKJ01017989.1:974-1366(+)
MKERCCLFFSLLLVLTFVVKLQSYRHTFSTSLMLVKRKLSVKKGEIIFPLRFRSLPENFLLSSITPPFLFFKRDEKHLLPSFSVFSLFSFDVFFFCCRDFVSLSFKCDVDDTVFRFFFSVEILLGYCSQS